MTHNLAKPTLVSTCPVTPEQLNRIWDSYWVHDAISAYVSEDEPAFTIAVKGLTDAELIVVWYTCRQHVRRSALKLWESGCTHVPSETSPTPAERVIAAYQRLKT